VADPFNGPIENPYISSAISPTVKTSITKKNKREETGSPWSNPLEAEKN